MKPALVMALLALLVACSPAPSDTPAGLVDTPRFDGKWVMINYWAIWCAPCREEIPELNSLAQTHAAKLNLYAVNFDDKQGEELLVQAAELDIKFDLLTTDPGPALGYARPTVLPTTVIFNPDGEMVARLFGPQTEESLSAAMQPDE